MNKKYKHRLFLLLFSILSPVLLYAQTEVKTYAQDTSWFKSDNDSWNLVEAVIQNNPEIVKLLLDRGAYPNAISSTGNSALMYACEKGNLEIISMLIGKGANVNAIGFNGETPLFLAIFNNDFQTAKYLLEHDANPNVKDGYGVTPLIYAAATNQYQSADLLMFYEADESVSDENGNDPLMAAVTYENIETTDVLLQNGLNPNVQDSEGNTPAIVATQHGRYDILALLLEYKADANIANKKNYTPLAYAITYNDLLASKLLIENGADVNHKISKGRNLAEIARINGNDSISNLLNTHGAGLLPGPDFSEFQFIYGNAFNNTDYLVQLRGALVDTKYGYYFETGIDFRPFLLRTQVYVDDTLYQFRERRIGWSHGVGRYFKLYENPNKTLRFSLYTSVNGYLSFPNFTGSSNDPGVQYKIVPSAGALITGRYIGMKAGAEWFNFDNILDKGLKYNVTIFFRLHYPEVHFDRKEIYWE